MKMWLVDEMNIIKQWSLFYHAEMVLELGWRGERNWNGDQNTYLSNLLR